MNDEPVIGVNSQEANINIKESFNKISLSEVLGYITNSFNDTSLDSSIRNAPIILHCRMKTKNPVVYKKMADIFDSKLSYHKYDSTLENELTLYNQTMNATNLQICHVRTGLGEPINE